MGKTSDTTYLELWIPTEPRRVLPPPVIAGDPIAAGPDHAEPHLPGRTKGAQKRLAPRRRARQQLSDAGAGPGKVYVFAHPKDALHNLQGQLPLQVRGPGLFGNPLALLLPLVFTSTHLAVPVSGVAVILAMMMMTTRCPDYIKDYGRRAFAAAFARNPDGCQLHLDDAIGRRQQRQRQ
ncbi:hypothetical protein G7054_g5984 [Neopestalotiopsis clavispora]|nr:hypothetical protein G7054_g5984 [Neopestalotiopsis clavispora]